MLDPLPRKEPNVLGGHHIATEHRTNDNHQSSELVSWYRCLGGPRTNFQLDANPDDSAAKMCRRKDQADYQRKKAENESEEEYAFKYSNEGIHKILKKISAALAIALGAVKL